MRGTRRGLGPRGLMPASDGGQRGSGLCGSGQRGSGLCGSGQRGSGTVAFVAVTGLSLVLVLAVVNLVVFQYARGVVRAALDEGARAGSRLAVGAAECEARAQSVIVDLAGGPISSEVVVTCQERGDLIVATASGTLPAVSPLVPSWSFVIAAEAVKERASP